FVRSRSSSPNRCPGSGCGVHTRLTRLKHTPPICYPARSLDSVQQHPVYSSSFYASHSPDRRQALRLSPRKQRGLQTAREESVPESASCLQCVERARMYREIRKHLSHDRCWYLDRAGVCDLLVRKPRHRSL